MPWPDQLGRLLGRPDSRAAQALRWGLRGLRAALQAALADIPDDPGGAELRGVLAELDALLEPAGSGAGPSLPVDGEAVGHVSNVPALELLIMLLRQLVVAGRVGEQRQGQLRRAAPTIPPVGVGFTRPILAETAWET
jgi:hypothetical protein